jgi:hypothetical protein
MRGVPRATMPALMEPAMNVGTTSTPRLRPVVLAVLLAASALSAHAETLLPASDTGHSTVRRGSVADDPGTMAGTGTASRTAPIYAGVPDNGGAGVQTPGSANTSVVPPADPPGEAAPFHPLTDF